MSPHRRLSEAYDRALSEGTELLSNEERDLYLIQDFIIEVEMGGLSGYFYNRLPVPNQISASISAMRKYALNDLADVLSDAFRLFDGYSETGSGETWSEILCQYDPGNWLAILEKRIDAMEDYGLDRSLIASHS